MGPFQRSGHTPALYIKGICCLLSLSHFDCCLAISKLAMAPLLGNWNGSSTSYTSVRKSNHPHYNSNVVVMTDGNGHRDFPDGRRARPTPSLWRGWSLEYLCALASVSALVGIIVVLQRFDQHQLPVLPLGVTVSVPGVLTQFTAN